MANSEREEMEGVPRCDDKCRRSARGVRKEDTLARQCEHPPRCEPWGGWGSGRVSRLLPASAGFFGEARDASRSLGAALKGGALKMLEDAKFCKEAGRALKETSGGLKEP